MSLDFVTNDISRFYFNVFAKKIKEKSLQYKDKHILS